MSGKGHSPGPSIQAPMLVGVLQFKIAEDVTERMFYVSTILLNKYAPKLLSKIIEKQEQDISIIGEADGVNTEKINFLMIWLRWLNIEGKLGSNLLDAPFPWARTNSPGDSMWFMVKSILSFYNFGLQYSIREFCEAMVDHLSQVVDDFVNTQQSVGQEDELRAAIMAIKYGYFLTSSPCQLRHILVDGFYATKLDKLLSRPDLKELPQEFLEDITLRRVTLPGYEECVSGARKSLKRQRPGDEEASRKKQKVSSSDEDEVLGERETRLATEDTKD